MNSVPEPPEDTQFCQPIADFRPTELKNEEFMLFYITKFVVIFFLTATIRN